MILNLNLNLNTKNKVAFMTVGIFLLAVFIGYNFIFKAAINTAEGLKITIKESDSVNLLLREMQAFQDKINAYLSMRIDAPDPSKLLSKIDETASACGIKIDSVTPGGQITEGEIIFLPCKIKFKAPYNKTKAFINKLEHDKKFIKIQTLSLNSIRANVSGEGSYSLESGSWGITQPANLTGQVIKKSRREGVWLQVEMEIVAFFGL